MLGGKTARYCQLLQSGGQGSRRAQPVAPGGAHGTTGGMALDA